MMIMTIWTLSQNKIGVGAMCAILNDDDSDDNDDDDSDDDYDDDDDDDVDACDVDNDHLQKNLPKDVRKELLVGRMSIRFEAVGALQELF